MDLGFAIDELYSAGWWPKDADACVRCSDGRWYPGESAANAAFAEAGWEVGFEAGRGRDTVRTTWRGPGGIRGAAISADPVSARLMAFAALYRFRTARDSRAVDPRR
jgi:hypothetical protein